MPKATVTPLHETDERLQLERQAAARIATGVNEGQPAAESELVERYANGLLYLLTKHCGDRERARDLLQDTFLVAIGKLRQQPLEQPERLAGFLRGIAVRIGLNAGRRQRREPVSVEPDTLAAISATEPPQFASVSAGETGVAVQRLLASMPVERDRQLLLRYYVYEHDKPEICAALGLDSLHFNRVLHRAKRRFRELLEKSGQAESLR